MQEISASKFKATCLSVMEQVRTSGEPVLVTKRGEPLIEVVPAKGPASGVRQLGALRGSAVLQDDLIEPAAPNEVWESHGQ